MTPGDYVDGGDYVAGGRRLGDVPYTTEATSAREVVRLSSRRIGFPAGWWGMAMLIASEATLFGSFIGTYYYLRFHNAHWPPPGAPKPELVVPLVMAGVLATTSVPMQVAARAAKAGRLALTRLALVVALVVQCGYFSYQILRYHDDLQKLPASGSAYASIYQLLLGADHGHVFVGLVLNVWLLAKLAGGLTMYRLNAARAITIYWHAVNVLTLVVVGTLVSARG